MTNPNGLQTPTGDEQAQPLLTHEKSLSAKIGRGSEASDLLDQQLVMLGFQLIIQLNTLIKTSRLHGRTNAALDKPVETMLTLIHTLAHDQPATLRVQDDFLFLGEQHLKVSAQQMVVVANILEAMAKWKIGGLTFSSGTTSQHLRDFAYLFVSLDPATKTLDDFRRELTRLHIDTITLEDPRELSLKDELTLASSASPAAGSDPKNTHKARSKSAYAQAGAAVNQLTQSAREGGTLNFKQAKRAIQNIVDLMLQDEAAILGLTNLRCHDQYTHNHSVNVALLSMALGNRAGYSKLDLADLGLAALFHDIGKCAISLEILNKPGEFTEEEWRIMRSHPVEGVLTLVALRGLGHIPGRMASASFEHHMNFDASGYPQLAVPWTQSVSSRIITIADCYDAMTSSRVYRREPMSPAKVLNAMFNKAGTSFDPTLLKLFVNCVGIVPIGSLVVLDTAELAVVLRPAADKADAERPLVRIITDPHGNPIDNGPEVDLAKKDAGGRYLRSIVRLIDTAEHKFDTGRYFL